MLEVNHFSWPWESKPAFHSKITMRLKTKSRQVIPYVGYFNRSNGVWLPPPQVLDEGLTSYIGSTMGPNAELAQLSCSVVSYSSRPQGRASVSITNSQRLLKLVSIESVRPSNHLILCRPLFLSSSIFPSIRVFSDESVLCIRWPKYGSLSFSISPSNDHSGLVSFRMDWLDLLAVQGTLNSLL